MYRVSNIWLPFAAALLCFAISPSAAERLSAKVDCRPTKAPLVYVCLIALTGAKSGRATVGGQLVVGADMPSMPMAHNVKPVKARPTAKPGVYRVRLRLEMYGEWALRIRVSGALRDIIIHKKRFGTAGQARGHGCAGHHSSHSRANHKDRRLVALGRKVYAKNCVACHRKRLQGEPNWNRRGADGLLPAPPLNGSGHSAHHSDFELFKAVKNGPGALRPGVANYKTKMPGFDGTLSDREIWSVISFMKSRWPARARLRQAECSTGSD